MPGWRASCACSVVVALFIAPMIMKSGRRTAVGRHASFSGTESTTATAPAARLLNRPAVRAAVVPVALGAAMVFAAWLTLHFGRRGFMPLDQSIVFDWGWRTLHGQVPFRDYVTPDGVPAFAVQAVFFAVTGVTWLSLCLHAAIFDAVFVLLSYALLRLVEVPVALALPAAALGGVVFYPPFGTGFMDQDSFLFLLVAVTLAAAALSASRRNVRRVLSGRSLRPPCSRRR